jgi:DNA-directed RNA polymerase specialized sigma24 family protein
MSDRYTDAEFINRVLEHFNNGLNTAEIAKLLGTTEPTVEQALHIGRDVKRLKP